MKVVYEAIFTPFEEGQGYAVEVPDLPGCVTEGDSLAEAIEMGQDAASGWILGELEEGRNYPKPSALSSMVLPEGSFVKFLVVDIDTN